MSSKSTVQSLSFSKGFISYDLNLHNDVLTITAKEPISGRCFQATIENSYKIFSNYVIPVDNIYELLCQTKITTLPNETEVIFPTVKDIKDSTIYIRIISYERYLGYQEWSIPLDETSLSEFGKLQQDVKKRDELIKKQGEQIEYLTHQVDIILTRLPAFTELPKGSLTSSGSCCACTTRLNVPVPEGMSAWTDTFQSGSTFVQVDLQGPKTLYGVVLKGVQTETDNCYVKKFRVLISLDGTEFNEIGEFEGNHDGKTAVIRRFSEPVVARHVKLVPIDATPIVGINWNLIY